MKASEVFDLPVVVGEKAYDSDDIFQANGSGLWCATFCSDEQAKVAARAINHADALADALAELLECAAENNLECLQACDDADAALEAYRGAK